MIALVCFSFNVYTARAFIQPPDSARSSLRSEDIGRIFHGLENAYENCYGNGKFVNQNFDEKGIIKMVADGTFEFARVKGKFRILKTGVSTQRLGAEKKNLGDSGFCYDEKNFFRLRRMPGETDFAVTELSKVSQREISLTNIDSAYCFDAPYSAGGTRLSTLVDNKQYKLENIIEVMRDGRVLKQLQFAFNHGSLGEMDINKARTEKITVLVDPEHDFIVLGFAAFISRPKSSEFRVNTATIEYDTTTGAKPAIKSHVRHEIDTKSDGSVIKLGDGDGEVRGHVLSTTNHYFDSFMFGPTDDNKFMLGAFGIPDITQSNENNLVPQTRRINWFFVMALLSLAIGMFLKIRAMVLKSRMSE